MGGFLALGAVFVLGARRGRYTRDGQVNAILPSSIPFLALGSWILCVGWFGFNVMSAGNVEGASGPCSHQLTVGRWSVACWQHSSQAGMTRASYTMVHWQAL